MKKILFFETGEFTGATRVTRTLAKAAKTNYKVAFAKVGEQVREDIESAIEQEKPDILFSSFIRINSDVIEKAKEHSLTVVIRNDYKLEDVDEITRARALETYHLADQVVAQTEEMKESLLRNLKIKLSKVVVLENPLDKEEILKKASVPNPFEKNGNFHFLWVGRIVPIKDVETLQKAFRIVHNKYPNTDLTLISDDPNPYQWMSHSDCLVISSISEASPNVLREALFLGKTVVSTDCSPTVRELLPKEQIVPIEDATALSEAMIGVFKQRMF